MTKEKVQKDKAMIYKTLHRKLKSEQQEPRNKSGSQTRCSAKVSSPYPTIGIGRVTFVKHPVACIHYGSGVIMTTIKGTYPWSLMRYSVPFNQFMVALQNVFYKQTQVINKHAILH